MVCPQFRSRCASRRAVWGAFSIVSFAEETSAPAESAADPESRDALRLQVELESTRETLQATIAELETANEELQAMNEEMMASTEELQASNEELETINEELQASNEELSTLNEELHVRSRELSDANRDLPGTFRPRSARQLDPCRSSEAHHSLFTSTSGCSRWSRRIWHALNRIATTIALGLDKALDDTLLQRHHGGTWKPSAVMSTIRLRCRGATTTVRSAEPY